MAEAKAQAQEAKQEAKAGTGAGGEELSMEEILHSIRKIIAEDDPDGKKANGKPKEGESVPGSDVLELTEMIKDDGSIESLKPAGSSTDILQSIDKVLEKKPAEKPAEKAAEKAVERPVEVAAAEPVAAPAAAAAKPAGDYLLSETASSVAMEELKKLKSAANPDLPPAVTTPAPHFRSGLTVEDMVIDMLKPMMKAWLDTNLAQIVERIVEREVKKLTK
jgi:cell pole-organizing protein PopZ